MLTALLALVFLAHVLAVLPSLRAVSRGQLPGAADFAILSVLLFYDLGIFLELSGFPYESQYFAPFSSASESVKLRSVTFIGLLPFVLWVGARLIDRTPQPLSARSNSVLHPARRTLFYAVCVVACVLCLLPALRGVLSGVPLWALRARVGRELGPLVVLLYLPLYLLAFYVRQADSRSRRGLLVCLGLTVLFAVASLPIGERTNILLPVVILALFRFRLSLSRLVLLAGVFVVLAAALLPIFKWQFASGDTGAGELLTSIMQSDLARAPVLNHVLQTTDESVKGILPYPLAGYVYGAFFLAPRSLAPFKGYPTASWLTSSLTGRAPSELAWGFGLGAIEEAVLNAGPWLAWVILLGYGMLLGWLEKLARRIPALAVPTRLAPLWLCGYHMSALLLTFGCMAVTCWACQQLFGLQASLSVSPVAKAHPSANTIHPVRIAL